MKFSFIVPVSKKDSKYLRRCVLSIKEQDYDDREVIIVGDAGDKKTADKVEKLKDVKYVARVDSNASAKRNVGASYASGDVLFFFDVDCMLLSGMLRLLKDTLDDNPDCSFVYGSYRYNDKNLNTFPSRPFDPYLLETANYISTMSPIRKKDFIGFDETLDHFQDWDLFLRMSKQGKKGHFLPDVIFTTEVPDEKSISGTQDIPYIDRVNAVRQRSDIKDKPICVSTLGAPYQSIQRAKILNADYYGAHEKTPLIQMPSMFPHNYKMIYVMGFYPMAIHDHAQMFANAPKDCLKVIQWIGTDVYQLRTRFPWEQLKYIRDNILKHIDVQLCNCEWLEEELGELGIKAHRIYMPIVGDFKPVPLPEKFTVGVYYSSSNPMHNEKFLLDIAKSMPDVEFKFFGGSDMAHEGNIEFLGWADIHDIISKCSMNVRMTVHDGFPHVPIQFLLSGRQVVINSPMPHMHHIPLKINEETYAEAKVKIIEKIRSIKKNLDSKENKANIERGSVYYRNITDPENYRKMIYTILEKGKTFMFQDERIIHDQLEEKERDNGSYRREKACVR